MVFHQEDRVGNHAYGYGMSLYPVNSSSLAYVGFKTGVLAVVFHTSSTTYFHPGVPYSVFAGLMSASSLGAYYNRHIRGRYK